MNTQAKHTPRPWRTIESTNTTMRTVVGPDFPGQGYIADVNLCRTNDAQDVDGEANARLIAAAPELLQLVKDMREAFYVKGTRKALLAVMERSKSVMEKAEGREG